MNIFEIDNMSKTMKNITLEHQEMSSGNYSLAADIPSEHQNMLKVLRQLPMFNLMKPIVMEEKIKLKEPEASTLASFVYEVVNLIVHNMAQLLGEK